MELGEVVSIAKPVEVRTPPLSDPKRAIDYQDKGEGLEATNDIKGAFRAFFYSATYGHPRGMASRDRLALLLSDGDMQQVRGELLDESEREGEPVSLHVAGILYEKGWGVQQNYGRAIRFFVEAAKMGFLMSIYSTAVVFSNGMHVKKDWREAARLYNIAAEAGCVYAMSNLARCSAIGLAAVPVKRATPSQIDPNQDAAVHWFSKAAMHGDSTAMTSLGYKMFYGVGCKVDKQGGVFLMKKGAEAEDELAYLRLASCYSDQVELDFFLPVEAAYYAKCAMKYASVEEEAKSLLLRLRDWLPLGWERTVDERIKLDENAKERKRKERAVIQYMREIEDGELESMNKLMQLVQTDESRAHEKQKHLADEEKSHRGFEFGAHARQQNCITLPHASTLNSLEELNEMEACAESYVMAVKQRRREVRKKQEEEERYEKDMNDKCKVCFDGEINTVLEPCNHLCLCENCSSQVSECPICRGRIQARKRVYHA